MCGLHQESNCFNPVPMPKSMFSILEDDNVKKCANENFSSGGIVSYLESREDVEAIYSILMRAPSGAPVKTEVVDYFLGKVLPDIKKAGKLDGIAISLHGATMSVVSDDVCGDVLEAIRKEVGEDMPISAAFDLHANITEKIARNADYICGFNEYPHIDQAETGLRAAKILMDHLEGRPAKTVRTAIPMIAPAHAYTTKTGKLVELVTKAKAMVASGRIVDYTIFEVQPWLDTKEMAATVTVIAKDEETAKEAADELALGNFNLRKDLMGAPLTPVCEVVEKALKNKTGKPIVLVDSADSRGAGSTADSAEVLRELLPYKDTLKCAVSVSDAPAVKKAFEVGVGNRADFTLGATVAPELFSPVEVKDVLVRSLHDGYFTDLNPVSRGNVTYCGRVAVLQIGKILVQLSESSDNEGDMGFYRGFGIDPEFCDIVSVKACTSFRAGYEPIAAEICNTATPGAAGTVLTDLPYKNRPMPLYPFEEITENDITKAKCFR